PRALLLPQGLHARPLRCPSQPAVKNVHVRKVAPVLHERPFKHMGSRRRTSPGRLRVSSAAPLAAVVVIWGVASSVSFLGCLWNASLSSTNTPGLSPHATSPPPSPTQRNTHRP
ncbi:unnamed protein product, partial [Ectocarpus sp. 12 AP-2014]